MPVIVTVVAAITVGTFFGYMLGLADGYTAGKRHGVDAAISEIERQAKQ